MSEPLQALIVMLCGLTIFSDLYAHRVRNAWLLLALLSAGGWLLWSWARGTAGPPWPSLAGLLIGLGALLPFYIVGWMGAGDVKFFATLGFLLGGEALLPIWIIASLLGGMHAIVITVARQKTPLASGPVAMVQTMSRESRLWQRVMTARQGRKGIPYAAYMAIGALFTLYAPNVVHW
ncbi:Prepilin type IV endopeptidase peptidase domain-containing protein [Rhodanobacter sp. Root179]|uniref:A24 family peptidase n=1 Tax=unclassified Rhodanobacter TaxID=2621553 RepID=UPI0009EB628E|nr:MULTISPECIES: prepilin peptidase [unclassified Rhodanobacter]